MRGLKHNREILAKLGYSRIFYRCVDWNMASLINRFRLISRIFYRCVDWNDIYYNKVCVYRSHLLQMRGLKRTKDADNRTRSSSHLLQMRGLKLQLFFNLKHLSSRIFYRCVDWNAISRVASMGLKVASFTDAWIETLLNLWSSKKKRSHLLQMRGLKRG